MNLYASFLPIVLLFAWPSCESDQALSIQEKPGKIFCAPEMVCSRQFVSVTVAIINEDRKPVKLDSVYSQSLTNGKKYYSNLPDNPGYEHYYTVLSDNEFPEVSMEGSPFAFIGFKGGKEIVNLEYEIGHDCCHIRLISGPSEHVVEFN